MATESFGFEVGSARDRYFVFLFFYETVHELVALFSGVRVGDFARGGLDCDYWRARLADADSLRCGDVVGGRLRRAVCVPGHCLRQRSGIVFDSEAIRNYKSAADCARNARRSDCTAELVGIELRIAMAGLGRNYSRCGAARVSTFPCESRRFEQTRRCVFHGERLY